MVIKEGGGGETAVQLDTGCSQTMVRRNLVPEHKLIKGKGVAIRLFKLLGREEPEMANVDDVLVVMTRAK